MMMEQLFLENLLKFNNKIKSEFSLFVQQKEFLDYNPDEMLVYDLCKSIARIAVMVEIDFARWSLDGKFDFVDKFLRNIDPEIVREGVRTFHENCDHFKL